MYLNTNEFIYSFLNIRAKIFHLHLNKAFISCIRVFLAQVNKSLIYVSRLANSYFESYLKSGLDYIGAQF